MNKKDLPEWVKRYDRKGVTFRRKTDDCYFMVAVKSERVPGRKYPVLRQTYLGAVYSDRGFVPTQQESSSEFSLVECGLSHFIYANFRRDLMRSAFNSGAKEADGKIRAAIVLFLYGTIDDVTITLSAVSVGHEDEISAVKDGRSVANLSKVISRLLGERIGDEKDLRDLVSILRQSMADRRKPEFSGYPEKAEKILRKWGDFE